MRWKIAGWAGQNDEGGADIVDDAGIPVCHTSPIHPVDTKAWEEYRNRAYLVAAAPDILEALTLFIDMWNSGDSGRSSKRAQQLRADMWEKANAAIARVKGGA